MIRKTSLIIIAVLFFCIATYAFTSHSSRADFTYVNPSGIHSLDPARLSWTQDFRVALNIWEGLTTWHRETTQPMEGAAYFPPDISPDGTVYTFTIRDDARWSNGDRVIADENWSSRNQNKLLFKGKYPRLYYWFAIRWLVKEVAVAKMWRQKNRPYKTLFIEGVKAVVARAGVWLVDRASFYRSQPDRLKRRHA